MTIDRIDPIGGQLYDGLYDGLYNKINNRLWVCLQHSFWNQIRKQLKLPLNDQFRWQLESYIIQELR